VRAIKHKALGVAGGDLCNIPCFKGELVARLLRGMPEASRLDRALTVFGALADRQRLKILYALRDGEELCVCDVAHVLGTSVSTASHHLRKLRDMGILKDRDDGKMVYYSLQDSSAAALVSEALAQVGR
jgi:DNA-binding transcriptional ArsR family regulator